MAILIFSLGALAVLSMTSGSFKINSHSEAVDIAGNLARRQMDTILSLGFADVVDRTGDGVAGLTDSQHFDPANPLDPQAADYSVTVNETSGLGLKRTYNVFWNVAADTPEPWAKTLAVIVEWQGGMGSKQVTFRTIWTE